MIWSHLINLELLICQNRICWQNFPTKDLHVHSNIYSVLQMNDAFYTSIIFYKQMMHFIHAAYSTPEIPDLFKQLRVILCSLHPCIEVELITGWVLHIQWGWLHSFLLLYIKQSQMYPVYNILKFRDYIC